MREARTALLQILSHGIDFGLGVRESVEAPRLHWDGACVQVEPGFPEESLGALRTRTPVNVWPERDVYFGGVHAVNPEGEAMGDPRRGGAGVVL